jgi:ATP-dependent helicase/nuclease subunit B
LRDDTVTTRPDCQYQPLLRACAAAASAEFTERRDSFPSSLSQTGIFTVASEGLWYETGVQIRFLLGPAGSGKTQRCLSEAGSRLLQSAEGDWLVFVAPKQATFQLERQLLSNPEIKGYSRLQIFSFERLARFVLKEIGAPTPNLLSEQGRVMVLRAILEELADNLEIFHTSARRMGFVEELSKQLREFQQAGLGAEKLVEVSEKNPGSRLGMKLRDLGQILQRYNRWLADHKLEDGDSLLSAAADALTSGKHSGLKIEALWLDGFAQMTPQERALLRAVLPFCKEAALAFCTATSTTDPLPWYSCWSLVQENYTQCRNEFAAALPEAEIATERLEIATEKGRFSMAPLLAHLERHWNAPIDYAEGSVDAVRMRQCSNPEKEATFCAREIRRHIRNGGRYREVALVLRSLESHADTLARVFNRYEIPFFLDRRESISHHPLAELTRGALRILAFDWRIPDIFRFLKSGLTRIETARIDLLENVALEHGWTRKHWRQKFVRKRDGEANEESNFEKQINKSRLSVAGMLRWLQNRLGSKPTAKTLKRALEQFWERLRVETKFVDWDKTNPRQVHLSVLQQMKEWIKNVELAFGEMEMPVERWIPILESGLASLTVGLIPPALDQVLIGSVDRSRNPDLKHVFVLGMTEGLFPLAFNEPLLLSESERKRLGDLGCRLGGQRLNHLATEQFYAYIACTRARESLTLTFSDFGSDGKALNPSRILKHLQQLCSRLEIQRWDMPSDADATEHLSEMWQRLIVDGENGPFWELVDDDALAAALRALRAPVTKEYLSRGMVKKLYGDELRTSISRLEEFANCPFKFFISAGLRARERKLFELDLREEGSFQHEVVAEFHREVRAEGKRWRDLTADQASARIGAIAERRMHTFSDGLLVASEENKFRALAYKASLQEFIRVIIRWMSSYGFDPMQVELGFGRDHPLQAWKISLSDGSTLALDGRIDRIDICSDGTNAYVVVIDYKSSKKAPEKTSLFNGLQQQLPAYLRALCGIENASAILGVQRIVPAGFFYVNLRGSFGGNKTRDQVLQDKEKALMEAYCHGGLFDIAHLDRLDPNRKKEQFNYRLAEKDTRAHRGSFTAQESAGFAEWLLKAERHLFNWGNEIMGGKIDIYPLHNGKEIACEKCDYLSICRFDPWTQRSRSLKKAP